jgi:hypothetical protein
VARLLVSGSSHRYVNASAAAVSAYPFTIYARVRITAKDGNAHVIGGLFRGSGAADYGSYLCFENRGGLDEWQAVSTDNNNWSFSSLGPTASAGTWVSVVGVFASATGRTVYADGSAGSSSTASRAVAAVNRTTMGAYINAAGSFGDHFGGDIGEFGIAPVTATADEAVAHAKGFSGRLVWPRGGTGREHWDFLGNITNEPGRFGGLVLTPNGTPAKSDHPRMLAPRRRMPVMRAAAGGVSLLFPPFAPREPTTQLRM